MPQALEDVVPADAAVVAHCQRRRVDVKDVGSVSQAAAQKAQQRDQHVWLERPKTLTTRHAWKIAAQQVACDLSIKTFPIFEPRAMQHQQNSDDFADAQAGLWPTRRGAVPNQIGFPLWQKRFTKIIHRTKGFHQPFQHFDLQYMIGSAHFLGSLIHNALMPPTPIIGVNLVLLVIAGMDEAGIGQIPRAMPLHWLARAY